MKNAIRVVTFLAATALTLLVAGVVLKTMWVVFLFGWNSL